MSNYLVVDANTLITLAKADLQTSNPANADPHKGQTFLNQLLKTDRVVVITDTVRDEVVGNISFSDAKVINQWIKDNVGGGVGQVFVPFTGVPAGPNAGEQSMASFVNTLTNPLVDRVRVLTDDTTSATNARDMLGATLTAKGYTGITVTPYILPGRFGPIVHSRKEIAGIRRRLGFSPRFLSSQVALHQAFEPCHERVGAERTSNCFRRAQARQCDGRSVSTSAVT